MRINEFTLDLVISNYIKEKTPEKVVLEIRNMSSGTLVEMLEMLPQYMHHKGAIIINDHKIGHARSPSEVEVSYYYKGGTLEVRAERSTGEASHNIYVTVTHPCVPKPRAEEFIVLFMGKYIKQK